jgi:hypothetical protein
MKTVFNVNVKGHVQRTTHLLSEFNPEPIPTKKPLVNLRGL